MKSYAIALLLASCSAVHLNSVESSDLTATGGPNTPAPGAKKTDPRQVLPKYTGVKGIDMQTLEHCPDFNERFTLLNGVTKAVAYPAKGFNCNADFALAQGGPNTGAKGEPRYVMPKYAGVKGIDMQTIEHCPDFNERFTLLNGVTKAVPYPQKGFNCNADYALVSVAGGPNTGAKGEPRYVMPKYAGVKGIDMTTIEHCPDFNERFTLLNGVTKAVAYPAKGFNCNADYALIQGGPNTPAPGAAKKETRQVLPKYTGVKGIDMQTLEHCPDFNERFTLLNGVTKAVAYPAKGFNCNADYALIQGGPNTPAPGAAKKETRQVLPKYTGVKGIDMQTLEHCPDFNERFTLLNGVTKAVAYPAKGFNCNADYAL